VVSRDELLDAVWGHRFIADATVASRVKAARRAIGDSGAEQRLIRTVRGTGFRFVGEVSAPGAEPPPPAADEAGALVRRAELRRLRAALTDALAGRRRVVLVAGETGAGKSTLLERVLAEARGLDRVWVGLGRCAEHRGEGEPYLPVLDALARLCEGPEGDGVSAVLRARAPTWLAELPWLHATLPAPAPPGGTPERMLREMVEATEALAERGALVLALEDLHWTDPSTVDLLGALARRSAPARLLIVGTYRSAEAGPALRGLAPALLLAGAAEEIRLGPLDDEEIAALLAELAPGLEADTEVVRALHRRTGGNPLFARSVVEDWMRGGAIERDGGAWRRTVGVEALAARVPDSARRLVEARMEALPAGQQQVLEAGSVLGSVFSSAAAAALLDVGEEEAERRCAALTGDGGLLVSRGAEVWPDGTVGERLAFTHDLHRAVVYDRLTAARCAALHLRAGRRLEAAYGARAGEVAAELADHFVRGHDGDAAVTWSLAAAERALVRGARREGVEHLRTCLAVLGRQPDLPGAARRELAAAELLAPALVALEGWSSPAAEAAYRRARELALELPEPASASAALFGLAVLSEYRGDYAQTQSLLEQRLGEGGAADAAAAAASHELLACSLFHQGAYADALDHVDRAAGYGPVEPDVAMVAMGEDVVVGCHAWASLALWALDDRDAAVERAGQAVALARDPGRGHSLVFALVNQARLRQLLGDPAGALGPATEAAALAAEQGVPYLGAAARILAGWATARTGDLAAGLAELRAGLEAHAATGARMDRPYFLGLAADACLHAGLAEEALAAVREARAIAPPERPFFYEPALRRLESALAGAPVSRSGPPRTRRASR
jgi:tetratricopeptide (TPR) repeat protein